MTLLMLLMTLLFQSYRQNQLVKLRVAKVKSQIHDDVILDHRLNQLFLTTTENCAFRTTINREISQYNSLFLTYDGGIGSSKERSGHLGALLFLDRNGSLQLTTSPVKEQKCGERVELLKTGVKKIEFEFFSINKKAWVSKWEGEKESIPQSVWIKTWSGDTKTPNFSRIYPVLQGQKNVIYPKEESK